MASVEGEGGDTGTPEALECGRPADGRNTGVVLYGHYLDNSSNRCVLSCMHVVESDEPAIFMGQNSWRLSSVICLLANRISQ